MKRRTPKPYLPLQTRTRHRRSHRPHVPTLMRGTTPPTTRSPPHQSRPTENPPNRQPATVGEEERGWRDPTSRRTSMRAASDCSPPPTALHASQSRTSTNHPPLEAGFWPLWMTPLPRPYSHKSQVTPPATRRSPQAAAAALPAAAAPHNTSPTNNNRPEEMRTSCREQPAPIGDLIPTIGGSGDHPGWAGTREEPVTLTQELKRVPLGHLGARG
jgi:hypothetical protein